MPGRNVRHARSLPMPQLVRAQGTLSGWPGDVGERRKMVARLSTLQTQLRKMDADAERDAAQEQDGKRGAR